MDQEALQRNLGELVVVGGVAERRGEGLLEERQAVN